MSLFPSFCPLQQLINTDIDTLINILNFIYKYINTNAERRGSPGPILCPNDKFTNICIVFNVEIGIYLKLEGQGSNCFLLGLVWQGSG